MTSLQRPKPGLDQRFAEILLVFANLVKFWPNHVVLVSADADIWGMDEGLTNVMKAAVSTLHVLGVNVLSSYSLYDALQKAQLGTEKESTWHFTENPQRSAIWTSHFKCIKAYLDEVVVPSAWLKQVSLGTALDPTPLIPPLLANPLVHDDMIYEIALDVLGNYYCEELEPRVRHQVVVV